MPMKRSWEHRVAPLTVLLTLAVALSVPMLASLGEVDLLGTALGDVDLEAVETVSGWAGLGLTLFAFLTVLVPRRLGWLRGLRRSPRFHIAIGMSILFTVLVHTRGGWGTNLNALLSASFLAVIFTPLTGKLIENRHLREGDPGGASKVRTLWLPAHLLAASLFLVLLAFHILAVYYF